MSVVLDSSIDLEDHITDAVISTREAKAEGCSELYVINTSDFGGEEQKGEINLKFRQKDGSWDIYKIPDTWLPRDISILQPKEAWLKDTIFLDVHNKGFLKIVDKDVAEAVLDSIEAQDEQERLAKNESRLYAHRQENKAQQSKLAAEAREKYKAVDSVRVIQKEAEAQGSSITPRVAAVMQNKATDEQQKLASLKNFKAKITQADMEFIIQQCNRDYPKIKAWIISIRNNG